MAKAKLGYVDALGPDKVAAVWNGRNDRLMLKACGLSITVGGAEGACAQSLLASDAVVTDIGSALGLLLNPLRLVATLRD